MNIVLIVIGFYLLAGLIAITMLEVLTKRVSRRIRSASFDTQSITGSNNVKVSIIVTLCALLLFWPFAIYAAIVPAKK